MIDTIPALNNLDTMTNTIDTMIIEEMDTIIGINTIKIQDEINIIEVSLY